MIPFLPDIAERFGVQLFVALVSAGVLTGFALLVEAIANWFDDTDS